MSGLPSGTNLNFLKARTLLQACFGPHDLILNFDVNVSITIAGLLLFPTPQKLDQADKSAHRPAGTLTVSFAKTGLYVISGGGSNSVVRLSGNGLIVVDGKLPGNYPELSRKIQKIVDQPVRLLVNSNYYQNHTGTNAEFIAEGAQVLAQENVKKRLENQGQDGTNIKPPAFAYAKEQVLDFGRVEVDLLHFGPARTDGDSVVYFPEIKSGRAGRSIQHRPDSRL